MENIIKGYSHEYISNESLKGYYRVEFYNDDGRCLNHWLENRIEYCKNREDAVKFIEKVRSWNVFNFTQTLIIKIR